MRLASARAVGQAAKRGRRTWAPVRLPAAVRRFLLFAGRSCPPSHPPRDRGCLIIGMFVWWTYWLRVESIRSRALADLARSRADRPHSAPARPARPSPAPAARATARAADAAPGTR